MCVAFLKLLSGSELQSVEQRVMQIDTIIGSNKSQCNPQNQEP